MKKQSWPWEKWQIGNVVEDSGRNMQIVLFVDNDGNFKCMNDRGELNTYSCSCHTYKAKNVLEYYTIKQLNEESEAVKDLMEQISVKDKVIEHLKNEVIDLRTKD